MRRARHVQQPVRALEIAVILQRLPRMSGGHSLLLYAGQGDKYLLVFVSLFISIRWDIGISTFGFIFEFYGTKGAWIGI